MLKESSLYFDLDLCHKVAPLVVNNKNKQTFQQFLAQNMLDIDSFSSIICEQIFNIKILNKSCNLYLRIESLRNIAFFILGYFFNFEK